MGRLPTAGVVNQGRDEGPRQSLLVAYRLFRGLVGMERRADLAPLRAALGGIAPADEPNGELTDDYGLILALGAHDAEAVSRILAASRQPHFQCSRPECHLSVVGDDTRGVWPVAGEMISARSVPPCRGRESSKTA